MEQVTKVKVLCGKMKRLAERFERNDIGRGEFFIGMSDSQAELKKELYTLRKEKNSLFVINGVKHK